MSTLVLSDSKTRWLRLRSQGLAFVSRQEPLSVEQVIGAAVGLQAQEKPSALLGVRVRSAGLTAADVEAALYHEHSIIHTWCMRGTLHFVTAQDLAWMLPLLGPVFINGGRRRNLELGLDEQMLELSRQVIRTELAGRGPLTRQELIPALRAKGIPTEGQATIHVIANAALEGVVCVGPDRGGKATYALLEDWAGPQHPKERGAALAELARRYLVAFAPAGLQDFAYWSGLSMQDARLGWEGIGSEGVLVDVAGKPAAFPRERLAWLEEPAPNTPQVHLLSRFDSYLLGYASRELAVAPEFEARIHPGGGIIHTVILVDGRATGTWELTRRKGRLELTIQPFEELSPAAQAGIETEAKEIGRFQQEEIKIY